MSTCLLCNEKLHFPNEKAIKIDTTNIAVLSSIKNNKNVYLVTWKVIHKWCRFGLDVIFNFFWKPIKMASQESSTMPLMPFYIGNFSDRLIFVEAYYFLHKFYYSWQPHVNGSNGYPYTHYNAYYDEYACSDRCKGWLLLTYCQEVQFKYCQRNYKRTIWPYIKEVLKLNTWQPFKKIPGHITYS